MEHQGSSARLASGRTHFSRTLALVSVAPIAASAVQGVAQTVAEKVEPDDDLDRGTGNGGRTELTQTTRLPIQEGGGKSQRIVSGGSRTEPRSGDRAGDSNRVLKTLSLPRLLKKVRTQSGLTHPEGWVPGAGYTPQVGRRRARAVRRSAADGPLSQRVRPTAAPTPPAASAWRWR